MKGGISIQISFSVLQPNRTQARQKTPGWTAAVTAPTKSQTGKKARTTRTGPGWAAICDLIATPELTAQLSAAVKLHLQLFPLIYRNESISRHFPGSLCLQRLHIIKAGACSLFYLSSHYTAQHNTLGFGGCRQRQTLLSRHSNPGFPSLMLCWFSAAWPTCRRKNSKGLSCLAQSLRSLFQAAPRGSGIGQASLWEGSRSAV